MNVMSISQAARTLGVTIEAVQKLCRAGKIESTKRGGKWQIPKEAVLKRRKAKLSRLNGR